MNILIVTDKYPSEDAKYQNAFVHSRAKGYLKKNEHVIVLVHNNKTKNYEYTYEGVSVKNVDDVLLKNILRDQKYDVICVHFALRKMMETVLKSKPLESSLIIWVHGYEALSWKRRLFNFRPNFRYVVATLITAIKNKRQLIFFRDMILNQKKNKLHFVFVSKWMKNVTEVDTKTVDKIQNFSIIPNPINIDIFSYKSKLADDRLKIFNLRPYNGSKKYANDITIKIIKKLSEKPYFEKLEFNLYGDGEKFESMLSEIKKFSNVNVHKGFLNQDQIKSAHDSNGVLLMPTRQDAQGVSMCEAICSGLVPITSDNTAIPEFINEDYGYLCSSIDEYVVALEELYKNPKIFLKKSQNTKNLAKELSDDFIVDKELELMKNLSM